MDMRTPVLRKFIDHPSAWTVESLGQGKESLVLNISEAHLAAVDELLARTRHLAPQQVTREQFDHPLLNEFLREVRRIILDGRGSLILRGVTPERYSPEDFERIYWGFGTHLGNATVQSVSGDRFAHVKNYPDNPHARGYRTTDELNPHTDSFEIVGLMCVQRAESGGYSRLVSTLTLHNEILRTRPELLDALYRGTPNAVIEARGTDQAVTDFNVPVFSNVDGVVSCLFARIFIDAAVEETGVPLKPDFDEAMRYFERLAADPRFRLEFMLEPGEIYLWNNFVVLHSRTRFEDSPAHTRDLLRLWLNVEGGRPVIPELFTWANIYEELFRQRMAAAAAATA